jgi:hypothetical protein
MTQLHTILLRLARNPEAGFPNGDDARGYRLIAPLTKDGLLDVDEWRRLKERCTVDRLSPEANERADGWLSHRGSHWFFRYDEEEEGPDEPVFRLGEHKLVTGEYVTIHEADAASLVYRVAEATPIK